MATMDLNITEITSNGVPVDFNFSIGGKLTGNRKLAQTWLILFLTDIGSQEYYPGNGSGFVDAVRTGSIRKDADVGITFKTAADNVARNLTADPLTASLPNTEKLVEAVLVSYELDFKQSKLKLTVKLTPVSGDAITVAVPVAI